MNDQLTVKSLTTASTNVAGNYDSSLPFNRIASASSAEGLRNCITLDGALTRTIRISHQPRSATKPIQRTLSAVDSIRMRVDGEGNPTGVVTRSKVALQADLPTDLLETEYISDLARIVGFLSEGDWANARALYRGEI